MPTAKRISPASTNHAEEREFSRSFLLASVVYGVVIDEQRSCIVIIAPTMRFDKRQGVISERRLESAGRVNLHE